MLIHTGILCCAGVQINIQTFRVEISPNTSRPLWNLALSPSGHLLSEYMHYHWLRSCVSLSDFDISNFRDHGVFFLGPCTRNPSYTTVNQSAFKTYPKISNSEFLSQSLFLKLRTGRKIIIFFCSNFKVKCFSSKKKHVSL